MIVCPAKNFAFVHIPKTAGKSINKALAGYGVRLWGETQNDGGHGAYHNVDLAHLNACHAKRLLKCNGCGSNQFLFAFVRNPWDRAVSAWKYNCHTGAWSGSLKSWLLKCSSIHHAPQHVFLCNQDHELQVDFVGRYESLQADFDSVCDRLKIGRISLPRIGKLSTGKHYSQYSDAESRALVYKIYKVDIEMFGYSFTAQ